MEEEIITPEEETFNYEMMRYDLDEEGYILNVYFGCLSGTCTGYEGEVPEGYESLEEWADTANIRAYKVVDGNLAYDSARDAKLREQYEQDEKDNSCVVHKDLYGLKKELEDIEELNSTQYTKANAQGKILGLDNVKRVIPKIKISNINPYEYEQVDVIVNKKNILPNDSVDETINDLEITKNEDGSITLNGRAESKNLIDWSVSSNNIGTFENDVITITTTGSWKSRSYDILDIVKNNGGKRIYFLCESFEMTSKGIVQINWTQGETAKYNGLFSYTGSRNSLLIPEDTSEITKASLCIYSNNSSDTGEWTTTITKPMLYFDTALNTPPYEPYGNPIEYNLSGDSKNTTPIFMLKKDKDYYLSTNNINLKLYNYDGTDREFVGEIESGVVNVESDLAVTNATLAIPTGVMYEDYTIYPMLNYGSKAMEYEQYEVERLALNFAEYIEEGLFPSDDLYPSDDLFPRGTTISYILADASGNTALINGEEEELEAESKLILNSGFNTIYCIQDVDLDIEYCLNNLSLEGTTTKNNNFKILSDGSIEAHNGYFSGTIEATNGSFKGTIETENATINGGSIDLKTSLGNVTLGKGTSGYLEMFATSGGKEYETMYNVAGMSYRCEGNLRYRVSASTTSPAVELYNSSATRVVSLNVSDSAGWIILDNASGTQTIYGNGETGKFYCVSLSQTSLEENKENIELYDKNALEEIKKVDIYKYDLKHEKGQGKKHLGFIIGKDYNYSSEITSEDEDGKEIGVDSYSMSALNMKAIQELLNKVETLEKRIKELEGDN